MNVKLFLATVLVCMVLLYWVLPKTRYAHKLKMSIGLFYVMHVVGILFSLLGLVFSFVLPDLLLAQHFFELILLPVLFIYAYTGAIKTAGRNQDIYDEKQNLNMTQAAALTWPISIVIVFFLYAMYREGILSGIIFFPIMIYASFAFYSASTLYFFKRN